MGRPTKYKKEFAGKIIKLMSEGASKAEVARELNISRETLNEWCKDPGKKEFSDAIKRGEYLSEGWWEKMARDHLIEHPKGPKMNHGLWFMNMKNRFGWRDKQEITGKDGQELKIVLTQEQQDLIMGDE